MYHSYPTIFLLYTFHWICEFRGTPFFSYKKLNPPNQTPWRNAFASLNFCNISQENNNLHNILLKTLFEWLLQYFCISAHDFSIQAFSQGKKPAPLHFQLLFTSQQKYQQLAFPGFKSIPFSLLFSIIFSREIFHKTF